MDEDSHVMLAIWSHSHAPPLQPPADISFDLRRVPNPPKHIRDSYDGRSKRLREHLLHDATFTNLLGSAKEDILRFATERVGGPNEETEETCLVAEDETVTSPQTSPPATGTSNRTASEDNNDSDDHESEVAFSENDEEAQAPAVSQSREYDPSQEEPNRSSGEISDSSPSSRLLRISCFCERGRHRSVAFAEELGRMAWPRAWDVRVQHRDVEGQGRGKRSRKGRSGREEARRGGKRGAFGFGRDGYEP